jgi:16S rRNA (cytosine1402-N4)-methyltransferase
MIVHVPVLLEQVLHYLAPRGGNELLIDATVGEGGHSYEFLSRFPDLSVVGVDADPTIQAVARERLAGFGERMRFYTGWSQDFFAGYPADLKRPDTVLIDLGVSLFHYEKSGRGFSFSAAEKLDMRINPTEGFSAAQILAQRPEKEIADILYSNAGERYSRRIAKAIAQERPISTAAALSELVKRAVPASYRHGPIHPATKTFMALRIEANRELERLPELLEGALKVLKPGGRLGVISFHSLEDRAVKNFFKMKNRSCVCPPEQAVCSCSGLRLVNILTPKGVTADEDEIKRNPPSRSARLRVAEKIGAE